MKQCLIYNNSLRFSRATYGVLLVIAFIFRLEWLVLLVSVLTVLGAITLKLNIPYQLHYLVSKYIRHRYEPIPKESGELNFVAGATGFLLIVGYVFLYLNKYEDFAWIYILVVTLLIFLACFVGFCVATLMYILLKKLFFKDKIVS